jgi:thimet oligopeptidase
MHWILSGPQKWAGISGITMESDFVDAPSQVLEEWMRSPQVLAKFARHYQTGEAIPPEQVADESRFGVRQGKLGEPAEHLHGDLLRYLQRQAAGRGSGCGDHGKHEAVQPYGPVAGNPSLHVLRTSGGYSSAYYTYLWDKVIAGDFFEQFDRTNLPGGQAPMRYRRAVLEPGEAYRQTTW